MNKLLIITMFLFPMIVNAECEKVSDTETKEELKEITTDVPNHLKGATITITLADGKTSTVPAEKFKVVPRQQQFVVSKVTSTDKLMCKVKGDKLDNRVSLLGGNGPKEGLDRSKTSTKVTVESRVGAVGGVQYQRLITERVSVGAQVQSNESVLLNIGLDF